MALAVPILLRAGAGADTTRLLRSVELDPEECYRVRELSFSRGDVQFFLTDGYLIFSRPVLGAPVAAIFSADIDGGEAEVLLLPPSKDERRMLSQRAGSPNIDEHLREAAFFFADNTAAELQKQITGNEWMRKDSTRGQAMMERYGQFLRNLVPAFEARLVLDLLTRAHAPKALFAGLLIGRNLGDFEVLFDSRSPEQVMAGKIKASEGKSYLDVWTSYTPKSLAGVPPVSEFHADDYKIEAKLDANLRMSVVTTLKVRDLQTDLNALPFDLSRQMALLHAEVDGQAAEIVEATLEQTPSVDTSDRMFVIVPTTPLRAGAEHTVTVAHEGEVVSTGPGNVFFVGSRGRWYPHRNLEFSRFDLKFRFPKAFDLVAPGEPVADTVEGSERVIERRLGPVPMAGFNLGTYERTTVRRGGVIVEVCGNRTSRLLAPRPVIADPIAPLHRGFPELAARPLIEQPTRLQELADQIADIMEFYARRFGPPPLERLVVSPIPGSFGQGFGGLIYLSTMAYMSPSGKAFADMEPQTRIFFTQLMQAHEVAHQWWGNLVLVSGYHDEWIAEALANYSALLYLDAHSSHRAVETILSAYRESLLEKGPEGATVESVAPITQGRRIEMEGKPGAWISIMYGKGTWIIRMLHARMGDENFWRMLAELRRRYQRKNITTDQFRTLCAEFMPPEASDRSLQDFFEQWVWGTGIPELILTTSIRGSVAPFRVVGTLAQKEVADDFSADFPVEVDMRGKRQIKWVRSSSDPVTFSLAVPVKPAKVQLDPGFMFLRK
jgi:hypothetical protein